MKAIVIANTRVFGFDFFTRFYEIDQTFDLESLFLDGKIRNYEYRTVIGTLRNGRIVRRGSEFFGIDLSVMNLIAEKDKSSMRLIEIGKTDEIFQMIKSARADLFIVPGLIVDSHPFMRFISTYDENAFCALVPLPPRLTFLPFLLTPLDYLSWFFLFFVVIGSACVWKLLTRSFECAFEFILFVIGGFFGQFVELKVSRKVLVHPTLHHDDLHLRQLLSISDNIDHDSVKGWHSIENFR